jgi:hypothetical protein
VWLEFAVKCGYLQRDAGARLYRAYNAIIGMIVRMINRPDNWIIS